MKAVILAGGLGTRMRPLTNHLPKPLLPIVNVPFLERMVRWLAEHGVDQVLLSTGYLPGMIEDHFQNNPVTGVDVRCIVEDRPLGTGGGIRLASQGLHETFLALNGDVLTDLDVTAAVRLHRERNALITIVLAPVADPTQYGVAEVDASARIERFLEKPAPDQVRSNLINAGVYVIEPEALQEIPLDTPHSLERQLFPSLLDRGGTLCGYDIGTAYWLDIGTPAKYLQANFEVLAGTMKARILGPAAGPDIWCGPATRIAEPACITGPVAIGRECNVGADATIGPRVVLGDRVTVAGSASVRESVIWSGTTIGSGATVAGAILGHNCQVMPGAHVVPGTTAEDGTVIPFAECGNRDSSLRSE